MEAKDRMGVGERTSTDGVNTGHYRAKFTEEAEGLKNTQAELEKVKDLPESGGERLMTVLAKFHQFPWAQDTMVAAAQLEEVLIMFLHKHLLIDGLTLRAWADMKVLRIRALKALAAFEATHPPMARPDIRYLVEEYKAQA